MIKATVLGLCLTLMALMPVSAATIELNTSIARIDQNLFDTIEFPMDAVTISGTAWSDSGFGLRVLLGRSTETANHLYVKGSHYTNKINAMYGAMIVYQQSIGEFKVELGAGKTDYKSTWTVNGELPTWSDGTDSDWSYYVGVKYPIHDSVFISIGYADIYRKEKIGYGREETRSFSSGFSYLF